MSLSRAAVIREASVLLAYLAIAIGANYFILDYYFLWDDMCWIGGRMMSLAPTTFGRWTQHLLLFQICRRVFGINAQYYYLLNLCLHALNAYGVRLLYAKYFAQTRGDAHNSHYFSVAHQAFFAGLVFSIYSSNAQQWISSNSQLLLVLFTLASLIAALHYFSRPSGWLWLLTLTCCGLALFSHVYGLLLPFFILVLEIAVRPRSAPPLIIRTCFFRYLPFVLLMVGYIVRFKSYLLQPFGSSGSHQGSIFGNLAIFPEYLNFVVIQFWRTIQPHDAEQHVSIAVVCLGLGVIGIGMQQLWRKGLYQETSAVIVLFFIIWNGLVFIQTIGISAAEISLEPFYYPHRYYFNAVGFAVVVTFLLHKHLNVYLALLQKSSVHLIRIVKSCIMISLLISVFLIVKHQPDRGDSDPKIHQYFAMMRSFVSTMQRDLPTISKPCQLFMLVDFQHRQGPMEEDFYCCANQVLGFTETWTLICRQPKMELNPHGQFTQKFYLYKPMEGFITLSQTEYEEQSAAPDFLRSGPAKDRYPAFVILLQ